MDYYEMQSSKTKEDLKEIAESFYTIIEHVQWICNFRYEILIKILIDKRIIDTEEEIMELIEHSIYLNDVKYIINCLPDYSDVNDGKLPIIKEKISDEKKHISDIWESEVESMFNRIEELEHRMSITKKEEE